MKNSMVLCMLFLAIINAICSSPNSYGGILESDSNLFEDDEMTKEEQLEHAIASLETLYDNLSLKKQENNNYGKRMTYRYGKRAAMPYRFGKRSQSEEVSDFFKALQEQQDNKQKRLTYRYGK